MYRETARAVIRSRSLIVMLILLAALAVSVSIATQNAAAHPTFEPVCAGCHSGAFPGGVHAVPQHAGFVNTCATCHTVDTATPPLPSACAAATGCHGGVAVILTSAQHVVTKCGTTVGCHGVTQPTPTPTPTATVVATTVSLKVAPTSIKLKKTVKATGTVTPVATLAGVKVALKAEMKKGAKWIKAKTASAVVSATGTYKWTYKPLKKGSYRMTARITATSTYKASKSKVRTFKVK